MGENRVLPSSAQLEFWNGFSVSSYLPFFKNASWNWYERFQTPQNHVLL